MGALLWSCVGFDPSSTVFVTWLVSPFWSCSEGGASEFTPHRCTLIRYSLLSVHQELCWGMVRGWSLPILLLTWKTEIWALNLETMALGLPPTSWWLFSWIFPHWSNNRKVSIYWKSMSHFHVLNCLIWEVDTQWLADQISHPRFLASEARHLGNVAIHVHVQYHRSESQDLHPKNLRDMGFLSFSHFTNT